MYIRRGPLRHARMLVAVTSTARERDALVIESKPVEAPEDRGAEVVPVDLLAAPPLPEGPRDPAA